MWQRMGVLHCLTSFFRQVSSSDSNDQKPESSSLASNLSISNQSKWFLYLPSFRRTSGLWRLNCICNIALLFDCLIWYHLPPEQYWAAHNKINRINKECNKKQGMQQKNQTKRGEILTITMDLWFFKTIFIS